MRHAFLIISLIGAYALQAQGLKAGPMLGLLTDSSASVWAWSNPGSQAQLVLDEKTVEAKADKEGFLRFDLHALLPDHTYSYQIRQQGVALTDLHTFRTFPRKQVFEFDMALGSCAYIMDSTVADFEPAGVPFGAHYEIFDTIANRKPDVMFWLGDNVYLRDGEWNSRERTLYRYQHARQHPSYAHLLATGSHLAIWDDHDYGPNDSDLLWEGKDMTRDVFLKQWLNPRPASDSGIQTHWKISDVEIFLLDDRSFRPRYGDGSMFGPEQQSWLLQKLKNSTATFKIVATGSQLLSTQKLGEAYWERREMALKTFLDSLSSLKIPGILFVSGDVHVTEISRHDLEGLYPLYDFTFSPLTSLPNPVPVKNYRRVRKSYRRKRNFGWMAFRGTGDERRMVVGAYNRKGKTLWEHVIYAKALGW
ncbi:MAG: alkaline phosphatase [Bacteroidia bacterium]